VRSAGGKLYLKHEHQHCEAINRVEREFGKPTQGSSLQRCGEHSAQDRVFQGVKAHVRGVCIHVFVRVSCVIIALPVEVFPLVRQWYPDYGIGN